MEILSKVLYAYAVIFSFYAVWRFHQNLLYYSNNWSMVCCQSAPATLLEPSDAPVTLVEPDNAPATPPRKDGTTEQPSVTMCGPTTYVSIPHEKVFYSVRSSERSSVSNANRTSHAQKPKSRKDPNLQEENGRTKNTGRPGCMFWPTCKHNKMETQPTHAANSSLKFSRASASALCIELYLLIPSRGSINIC